MKRIPRSATCTYRVVKCRVGDDGAIGLAMVGVLVMPENHVIGFLADDDVPALPGFDDVERLLLDQTPYALRKDISELVKLNPTQLLTTLEKRYRGTVFIDAPRSEDFVFEARDDWRKAEEEMKSQAAALFQRVTSSGARRAKTTKPRVAAFDAQRPEAFA